MLALYIMFLLNAHFALLSIALFAAVFLWLARRGPATAWGDVGQALIFHQVSCAQGRGPRGAGHWVLCAGRWALAMLGAVQWRRALAPGAGTGRW